MSHPITDTTAPMHENSVPVSIALCAEHGDAAVVVLTDGRSICRMERTAWGPDGLQRASKEAMAGDAAAQEALWQALCPGRIGHILTGMPGRELLLQLPPALDDISWELASRDGVPLAARWSVSRRLLFEDALTRPPSVRRPQRSLRVLTVGIDVRGAADDGPVVFESLGDTEWSSGPAGRQFAANDILLLDRSAAEYLPSVWPALGAQASPPLVIVAGADSTLRRACSFELSNCASALLSLDDITPALMRNLLARLLAGRGVADAVRHLWLEDSSPVTRTMKLYGVAAEPLCLKPVQSAASLRQVTALSFDLVGSTPLLSALREERYSELLADFHTECGAIVARYGGLADEPQGDDGIMCYFGYPSAHEAAAASALMAGLEITKTVRRLNVQVRVGIATGRVAIRQGQLVGTSIHLAARLREGAEPDSVLVSESTRELVARQFSLAAVRPFEMKGIDGQPAAYRVLGVRDAEHGDAAITPLRRTAFIGRSAELAAISVQWEQAVRGQLRVVLVTGEPGIGKSRLVAEFRDRLLAYGERVLECRGLANGRDSAFVAVSDVLRRLMKLHDSESIAMQRLKIVESLPPELIDGEAPDLVAELLSVDYVSATPTSDSSARKRQRTLRTLTDWFRLAAGARPMCLLVEDAHWLDPSTREFLEGLFVRPDGLPLLVVITQRSDDEGAWRLGKVHESIELGGLSPDAARDMARTVCGEHALPRDVLRFLAARSDGVPLFLEESVLMALDGHGGFESSLPSLRASVPATLQDLLMARLDQLAEARPIAQLAAVLGREFSEDLLRAVLAHGNASIDPPELPGMLKRLESAGLLLKRESPGGAFWIFKHALIRDTAYQSLWERDRQRVHRDVATVLSNKFPMLIERRPELLAQHQAAAGLRTQAIAQWEFAARRAAAASAHEESISHIENAMSLLVREPAGRERDSADLRLQLLLASRYIATEGYGAERVERVYVRAGELCSLLDDGATSLKVALGLHGWHFMRGELDRALEIAHRSESTVRGSADSMQRMQANWAVAITHFHRGDSLPAVQRMDRCLAYYRSDLHRPGAVQDPGVMCLCYSAWAQWELGHSDEALARVRRVMALAHEIGHKFSLGEAYGFAASIHLFRGETEAGLECAERSISICDEGGFVVWLAHALVMRGRLRCDRGEFDAGLSDMREGRAMWVETGAVVTLPMYLSLHAEGCAMAGQPQSGLALLKEALALIDRTGERYHEAEVRRLMGELLWQVLILENGLAMAKTIAASRAETSGAPESWLRSALAVATDQHKCSFQLRAARGLARIWLDCDRHLQAAELLESTLAAMPAQAAATKDVLAARDAMGQAFGRAKRVDGVVT